MTSASTNLVKNKNEWEEVSQNDVTAVCRHKVDGGWLYSVTVKGAPNFTVTFVPDIDLTRYQAHLRDAYKKGYEDGHQDAAKGLQLPTF